MNHLSDSIGISRNKTNLFIDIKKKITAKEYTRFRRGQKGYSILRKTFNYSNYNHFN